MLWRMAWRNLWRHRGRTLIIGSAVALSYALMLVSMGIGDDTHQRMLAEAARAAGGDILVHGQEYWDTRASDVVIAGADTIAAKLARVPGVRAVMPRVLIGGLVGTAADTRPVLLQGVRPEAEAAMRDIARNLKAGSLFGEEHANPIVLGVRLVERLEAELGDRIILTATEPNGEVTRALFHLSGILETGTRMLDEVVGYTTLASAQRAVALGSSVTQIGLLVSDDIDLVAARVKETLGGTGDLEVLTWREAVPEMVGLVEIDDAFGYIYLIVIYFVVLFSITNTFLMAVMERVREFGLLSALGMRGNRVGRLMLHESVLLTALAMVAGFGLGVAGHLAIDHWGISMTAWGIEEIEMAGIDFADMVIRSTVNPVKWVMGSVVVALVTVASAVYPAWRAGRLAPAEAMRFYE